jgi:hypothetical protein
MLRGHAAILLRDDLLAVVLGAMSLVNRIGSSWYYWCGNGTMRCGIVVGV